MESPSLMNIIDQRSLKIVFVGGKGGVGKTTVSSALSLQLCRVRKSVLIVSTDPAHNLSDAFSQKVGSSPTLIEGTENLHAMEVDPKSMSTSFDAEVSNSPFLKIFGDMASAFPGIDELVSIMQLMQFAEMSEYECVVFDLAPTGHALRMLSMPQSMGTSINRLFEVQGMSALFGDLMNMVGIRSDNIGEEANDRSQRMEQVVKLFQNPTITTFVCVCIPEFLSVYETERLVQQLAESEIDTHNVVINQLVVVENGDCGKCRQCVARRKIQDKYLEQINELYEDFHLTRIPLLPFEVRGVSALGKFGDLLLQGDGDDVQKFKEFNFHPE